MISRSVVRVGWLKTSALTGRGMRVCDLISLLGDLMRRITRGRVNVCDLSEQDR